MYGYPNSQAPYQPPSVPPTYGSHPNDLPIGEVIAVGAEADRYVSSNGGRNNVIAAAVGPAATGASEEEEMERALRLSLELSQQGAGGGGGSGGGGGGGGGGDRFDPLRGGGGFESEPLKEVIFSIEFDDAQTSS